MKVRLTLCGVLVTAFACAGESIEDLADRNVNRSTARWEEPGATPDAPLDASTSEPDAALDAGALADGGNADAAEIADASADAGSDAGADAEVSDAEADGDASVDQI